MRLRRDFWLLEKHRRVIRRCTSGNAIKPPAIHENGTNGSFLRVGLHFHRKNPVRKLKQRFRSRFVHTARFIVELVLVLHSALFSHSHRHRSSTAFSHTRSFPLAVISRPSVMYNRSECILKPVDAVRDEIWLAWVEIVIAFDGMAVMWLVMRWLSDGHVLRRRIPGRRVWEAGIGGKVLVIGLRWRRKCYGAVKWRFLRLNHTWLDSRWIGYIRRRFTRVCRSFSSYAIASHTVVKCDFFKIFQFQRVERCLCCFSRWFKSRVVCR